MVRVHTGRPTAPMGGQGEAGTITVGGAQASDTTCQGLGGAQLDCQAGRAQSLDSVWQESMGVAKRVGGLRPGGQGLPGGMPWEARAWLGLEAREVRVALGDQVVPGVPGQPHPLRQGDSGRPGGGPSFHQPPAAASKGTSTTTVGGILYGRRIPLEPVANRAAYRTSHRTTARGDAATQRE